MRPTRPFEYRSGQLHCEQVDLNQVAEQVGTPCYIYSAEAIRCNYRTIKRWFQPLAPKICYAVKANSNLAVLRLLKEEGCGFDIVSGGELFRLNRVGANAADVIYSGVGKTDAELESAISQEIFSLVIESRAELKQVSRVARGRPVQISLRVNPEIDAQTHPYISTGLRQHKFGIDLEELPSVLDLIEANSALELIGIGAHIGSQILEAAPFVNAFRKIRELADSVRDQGFSVTHLDVGGGFGIPYNSESPLNLSELAESLIELKGDYSIVMEPGRFIVATAGILLTSVLYRKMNHGKEFAVVDAAMNDLIRPALYDAHHEIRPVREGENTMVADVVGPICETADFLARGRELPRVVSGDLLAVMDAGAYGFVASSNYNSRPRCAEVMVDGRTSHIIRRRETFEDLISAEE